MLKAGERVNVPGLMPSPGVETITQGIGKDLSLDEETFCIGVNRKLISEEGCDLTVWFETIAQPFLQQRLGMKCPSNR